MINAESNAIDIKLTVEASFAQFKDDIATLVANPGIENSEIGGINELPERRVYAHIINFFEYPTDSNDLKFQLDTVPEVLMSLAKLTRSGVSLFYDEYDLFCKLLLDYTNYPNVNGRRRRLNYGGIDETKEIDEFVLGISRPYDKEIFAREKKAEEEHRIDRLTEFLKARDANFFKLCDKHLLFTAVSEYFHEIFAFLPNIQDLIQEGFKLKRSNANFYLDRPQNDQTTMTLIDFFHAKPRSVPSKSRVEATFKFLLDNGLNVFVCGGRPNKPRSCLNFRYEESIMVFHNGKIEEVCMIDFTYLTHLENGAGCLNRNARHILSEPPPGSVQTCLTEAYITVYTMQDLLLKRISFRLNESKQIKEATPQFNARLLYSELVFKVPGQMRFIFSKKEFDAYIHNFDKLSMPEKINLRRMYDSFMRLDDKERMHLVSGFELSMTLLKTKMDVGFDLFADNVSSVLTRVGLSGNNKTGVQAIVFAYLLMCDIDESNVSAKTQVRQGSQVTIPILKSGPVRLPTRTPPSLLKSQPQPQPQPAKQSEPPVRILRVPGTSVTPGTSGITVPALTPPTETKAEMSFVEIQQDKRKPGNKQYADTINFVQAYMSLNPDKKIAAELNHPRFKQTLELTYRGLPLSEKIKFDQKIDKAKRAKASATTTAPISAPAKRPV